MWWCFPPKEDGNLSKRAKLPAYSINMDASPIGNFAPIHEAFWDMIQCGWIVYHNLTTMLHNHATFEGVRVFFNNFNHQHRSMASGILNIYIAFEMINDLVTFF